jgi:hypothetical protein
MDVVPPQTVAGRALAGRVCATPRIISPSACMKRATTSDHRHAGSRWLATIPARYPRLTAGTHGGETLRGRRSNGSQTAVQKYSWVPSPSRLPPQVTRGTFRDIEGDQLQRSVRSSTISLCNAITSSSFKSVLRSSCRCAQPRTMSCSFSWSNPGWPLVAAYSTTRCRQRSRSSIAAHSPP